MGVSAITVEVETDFAFGETELGRDYGGFWGDGDVLFLGWELIYERSPCDSSLKAVVTEV